MINVVNYHSDSAQTIAVHVSRSIFSPDSDRPAGRPKSALIPNNPDFSINPRGKKAHVLSRDGQRGVALYFSVVSRNCYRLAQLEIEPKAFRLVKDRLESREFQLISSAGL